MTTKVLISLEDGQEKSVTVRLFDKQAVEIVNEVGETKGPAAYEWVFSREFTVLPGQVKSEYVHDTRKLEIVENQPVAKVTT